MKEWKTVFLFLLVLLMAAPLFSAPVPDTGQTKCYDVVGNVITCPSPGQPLYGQDANYTINPMSYTKLDGSGNGLPVSATSWAMVRDNVTGLIWEVKTNKDGVPNYDNPHDADNWYYWYDSNPATNGGVAGSRGDWDNDPQDPNPEDRTDTEYFIHALNSAHFGGYSDWRVPTFKELRSIVNFDIPSPGFAINITCFPNTVASFYWSSTTRANDTSCAWGVHFASGGNNYSNSYHEHKIWDMNYVRAVRGDSNR
ncbi:MAG: DUF1566 domain-containing protein [Desulfatirhabdiaceae bacterium]